jgi:hypothetical protein
MPEKRKDMLEMLSHMLIGFALVLKGIAKAEHYSRHPFTVIFLFAAGAFILLGALFHHGIEKKVANFSALFRIAEGLALVPVGVVLLEKSSRLPYFVFFAAALNLGLGIFEFFTDAEDKKRLRPLLMAVLAGVFLMAAPVFAAFNFFNSGNAWAYLMSGILAACGLFLLLLRRKSSGREAR